MTCPACRLYLFLLCCLSAGIALVVALAISAEAADAKAPTKPVAPPPSKEALLVAEDWQKTPLQPVKSEEIDQLIGKELEKLAASDPKAAAAKRAPLTTDEQFIRRVTLDLTGKLPTPEQI